MSGVIQSIKDESLIYTIVNLEIFRMPFYLRIIYMYFRFLSKFLTLYEHTCAFLKPYVHILLAGTLNPQGIKFVTISKN